MNPSVRPLLRSPREILGDYVILPRLIDKVRLHARGTLPEEYVGQLLMPAPALDGRFLAFTGLDAERLRNAILSARTDDEVLAWVERHARPHSDAEKRAWAQDIVAYRPSPDRVHLRRERYPAVAAKVDVGAISVFDLIDLDEGRLPA
jgi:hypothetical protein